MYRVVIAEDEVFVRLGYKAVVNWRQLGMEVVADVPNGRDAYQAYVDYAPDIIMTDLRMPVMDGMELIRKVREDDRRTRFLIITCLDEFEKARAAVELGVSGYVLKLDADVNDLEAKLKRMAEELDAFDGAARRETGEVELPVKLREALSYLEESYARDVQLSDVAEFIGVTPNYLSRLFSARLGRQFTAELNSLRVRRAEELLTATAKPVGEIAVMTGFANATYFIRVFKKLNGATPNEYRAARWRDKGARGK